LRKAIEAMLLTAADLKLSPDRFATDMMLSAMSGAMRSALEAGASPAMFRKVREHLVLLCQSYMAAATAEDNKALPEPRCLTLTYLNGKDAESGEAQEHANSVAWRCTQDSTAVSATIHGPVGRHPPDMSQSES
jgi:hypothetical protein